MRITLAALDFETSGTFAATEGEPELENQPIQIGIALWNPPLPRPKAVARDYLKHTSRITRQLPTPKVVGLRAQGSPPHATKS